MAEIGSFKYFPVEFTKDGKIFDEAQRSALEAGLGPSVTDLYVASHGWNNDKVDANALYAKLFGHVSTHFVAEPKGRVFVLAGVLWPSIRFADSDLIPGGGEGGTNAASLRDNDASSENLTTKLRRIHPQLDKPDAGSLSKLEALVDKLDSGPTAQNAFVDELRKCLPPKPIDPRDDASDKFMHLSGKELFDAFSAPVQQNPNARGGGGALSLDDNTGAAAGLGDVLSGAKAAADRLLNLVTYYQMKERAGVVGGSGVNALLKEIRDAHPNLRIHLVGHSFGARVVTAATDGSASISPSSVTLLQGAFSHNGFAGAFDGTHDGFFRKVVTARKVAGPIVATHTINDNAVGIAYALASRVAGDNATAIGDESDQYGGIGRNGAIKMTDAECDKLTMKPADGRYAFAPHKISNLRADDFISGHGDVSNEAAANVVWQAAAG